MTLRALIADDEPPARRRMRRLLEGEPGVTVVGEAEDGPATVRAVEALRPELLLLDVQMPGGDGFEVVDDLTRSLPDALPAIVFVTAHDRHALRAFEVHAVDYLLKPYDRERLRVAIRRAERLLDGGPGDRLTGLLAATAGSRPLRRLVVRERGRIQFLRADEIEWVEAQGHYALIHTGGGRHLVRQGIAALAGRLDPERFARVHRGAIVNLDRVASLAPLGHGEYEVALRSGARVRASRTHASALRRAAARGADRS